ncbi:DinB family protein [Arthrospiribacter ruber]|uniref:DinB family protein n=2 Tax=Arthrospiribacter ruber TaxID=2487934 RepID=A0A951IT67_9BACT|nr:DinB family protein [Arthrospiribacter ruber]
MTEIDVLTKQTEDVYNWTHKLIKTIPLEKWDMLPGVIESTISWQVGHLIMSHYYHSIMVIVGHQMDIIQKIPLKEHDELFTNALPRKSVGKINPSDLINQLTMVQHKSIDIIKTLSLTGLQKKLEPMPTPHPIAKTKFEALNWNINHTMYHCGQIGIIKRLIDQRHDFGLRRRED